MRLALSTPTRIALGLTSLVVMTLLVLAHLGVVHDPRQSVLDGRCALCEAVAMQCCLSADRGDTATMKTLLDALVARNKSVLSAAVRDKTGATLAEAGNSGFKRLAQSSPALPGSQIRIPIYQNKGLWGQLEVCFSPLDGAGWWNRTLGPVERMILLAAVAIFVLQLVYLKRILRYLDPASVVPERVRAALDALAEGVVILDNRQQVVMANRAFADHVGRSPEQLQGFSPSTIAWSFLDGDKSHAQLPWTDAIERGVPRKGVMMKIPAASSETRFLSVNAIPILAGDGSCRGALATFDDVTTIEQQNLELAQMLAALKESRDEIQRQNRELHLLATCDPLTQCLNRRSFFEKLEALWSNAKRYGHVLSLVMVDIDHFKSVNDRFGHSKGDLVLKKVGEVLRNTTRDCDLVCRYGGEEFCILLSQQEAEQAFLAAERYRLAVAAIPFDRLTATASFGVATCRGADCAPQELLDRADKALYAAKRGGRNRVVSAESPTADDAAEPAPEIDADGRDQPESKTHEPFPTSMVRGLTSALACRDTMTAERSRRVAELCVATAKEIVSQHECRELEIAALLHDIGKLSVPDAILFKPGKLTETEWAVMRRHDRAGAEILESAGAPPLVVEIVRTHHAWYGGNPHNPSLPAGDNIAIGSRILAIADAFTAMVSDCCYRKACSWDEALAELRRAAGTQFDPQLVERFIAVVRESDKSRKEEQGSVSQQTVLDIGLQIERLAIALDKHDRPALSGMAGRLATTARQDGAGQLADVAEELERAAASDSDLRQLVQLTAQLLELCRTMQSHHLSQAARETSPTSSAGR